MINKINALCDLWDYLKNDTKPVVLYGMGDGADKIIAELDNRNIAVSGIFASDDFVRYHQFHGFTVKKYSELKAQLGDMNVLVCFGTSRPEVLSFIYKIADEQSLFAPDVAVIGGGLFDKAYAIDNIDRITAVYNSLADDISKQTFLDIISYKITGDISYLRHCETLDEPLIFGEDETFVDLGAYTGDTVCDFIARTNCNYSHIYAVEPDAKNYAKMVKNTAEYNNIHPFNLCISDKREKLCFAMNAGRNSALSKKGREIDADCVDNILNGEKATYIKMDVEGQELPAISGAVRTIMTFKPKLKIAAYHRFDDLLTIPEAVKNITDGYSLYLRHKPQIPAWDTDYYFI